MKILIINPDYGMTQEEMALRCRILEEYTAPDTQLAMVCPQNSGVELNSALDVVLAAPEIVQLAADGQNAGFDAIVLYCFSDPVIDACREALRIPVIGGAQASCLAALNVCRSFGVILADEARLPEKKLFLRTLGVSPERIGQIAAVNLSGISPWADRETTFKKLLACGQKMMRETHTEAIVLGCLSFLGLAEPLSRVLGLPVIDPAVAAVTTAESIVRQRLFTSKVSYPLLCGKAREIIREI
ncbi:aspartate/glutamate racemase family protein [Phascolarctobacterium sp. ET69]|uniref:aspartate/glutamate racemase family protein n=1 Tax=Phascolarctobacterium sp. ET69 TaxID=2939420 RepID=UPI00201158AA|nr:aspartate/glutamate racemase family protein [Phascolarctobacterium sp. ET69]MCL1605198.1 aspartate/glutamate racemase family protein [Phascolarctobacterium sp. ET69]